MGGPQGRRRLGMIPHFFTLLTRPDQAWVDIRRDEEKNSSNYLVHLLLWA